MLPNRILASFLVNYSFYSSIIYEMQPKKILFEKMKDFLNWNAEAI